MEIERIVEVKFIDDSERGYNDDPIRTVVIGDEFNRMPVREIHVECPLDQMPRITFVHGNSDTVTVLPGARIVHYTAELKREKK